MPARLAACLLLVLVAGACAPADPRQRILEERGRYQVTLVSWAQNEDAVQANLRVSGPVSSPLKTLTVKIELFDAAERSLGEVWRPLDVTRVERGAATEFLVTIPAEGEVDGLTAVVVPDPTSEQAARIPELAAL